MLVVGGVPPEHRDRVEAEVRRAVGGRLEAWARSLGLSEADYRVPTVYLTDAVYEHSREAVAAAEGCDPADIASCAECELGPILAVPCHQPLKRLPEQL